jgi:hypothetical protein
MYATLMATRSDQQGLIDDLLVSDTPLTGERRIGLLAAYRDLHAETSDPQRERLLHVGDAEHHIGKRLGIEIDGRHDGSSAEKLSV